LRSIDNGRWRNKSESTITLKFAEFIEERMGEYRSVVKKEKKVTEKCGDNHEKDFPTDTQDK
jgi:hypothetical protein